MQERSLTQITCCYTDFTEDFDLYCKHLYDQSFYQKFRPSEIFFQTACL
ncbi:hypothetical protein NEIFLAOT_00931 [Neisseria flavescens NRL30031/H210]|uniref:Uncharacterized protein n=1 Tax=Neisseria flavescens NRL30031/H210 TaxID=546264 RepID=C0ELW8_NEIFL|nr:hypothetical protein NEIFLAOT_00931 [Neisseria flavescens NRL30031/H210]